MRKVLIASAVVLGAAALMAACGGGDVGPSGGSGPAGTGSAPVKSGGGADSFQPPATAGGAPRPVPAATPTAAGSAAAVSLQAADRKIISTASLALEVTAVQSAVNDIRAIAESMGGSIDQLTSSGDAERQRANLTIRVPQDQFFNAFRLVQALGKVLNQSVGSEDVSDQYIDLQARLKASQRQEDSYLALLARAQNVSDVLTVERELTRVRGDVERLQGQINFLDRRVALATIAITLTPPPAAAATPPGASLTIGLTDVSARVDEVKALVRTVVGVVDASSLSVNAGGESAKLSFRVFAGDFDRVLASLQSRGEVRTKEVRDASQAPDAEAKKPDKPDARIDLTLIEVAAPMPVWARVLAIVLPIAFVALLGLGVVWGVRVIGRRGRIPPR